MGFAVATRHSLALGTFVSLVVSALSWSSAAWAYTVTTTMSKPTNVAAMVNEEGILFQWDATPEADNVFNYVLDRGTGAGAMPQGYRPIELVVVYNTKPEHTPARLVDPRTSQIMQKCWILVRPMSTRSRLNDGTIAAAVRKVAGPIRPVSPTNPGNERQPPAWTTRRMPLRPDISLTWGSARLDEPGAAVQFPRGPGRTGREGIPARVGADHRGSGGVSRLRPVAR